MALDGGMKDDDVKIQFATREGTYKQMPISEFFYPKRVPYIPQVPASSSTPVKTSFVKVKCDSEVEEEEECVCFTVGRELFYFAYRSFKQSQAFDFLDKRTYKGVAPTCHDINQHTASANSVRVAVGFIAGQVQIIDVKTKESLQIMNEDRSVEKSRVTCVKWYPGSENILLSAHISGFMYTYDITQPCANYSPQYHTQPFKSGDGYSIYTLKSKNTSISTSTSSNGGNGTSRNPLYKWEMSTDGSGVHSFEFSPCKRFLAIVTQNGYLRIIDHNTFELYGCMKSYFGGLLTCCWSPDGRYIVTGGEDDLITVWSFCEKCVVARGNGHRSWVSDVAFDPFCCSIPSDADMKTYYGLPSVSDVVAAQNPLKLGQDSANNNSSERLSPNVGGDNTKNLNVPMNRYNKDNSHDNGIEIQCNGDVQLSVPASAIRRLRTYSNVSKLSRMSIGLEGGAPPFCYRFGSVGQDAQLCLWEFDENILYFSKRKKPMSLRRGRTPSSSSVAEQPLHVNGADNTSDVPVNGLSGSDYSSSGSSHQHQLHNHTSRGSVDGMTPLVPDSRSNSVPHSINTSVVSTKDRKQSSKPDNASNGLSAIKKFATIGSHDHVRKETKEHKRNLSLPHFGLKNALNHNSGSSSKIGFNKKHQPPKVVKTFGTCLCPCLDDTTLLEPLVCKKVSQGRMTCLDFKDDCVVTTCQDGYIQLWKRPTLTHGLTSPTPSPPLKEQLKPSGTVV